MRDFHSDLDLGRQAERELFLLLANRNNIEAIRYTDYTKVGYDLEYKLQNQDTIKVEVKSLAGGYPTAVVEVWTDDAMTKRPHWKDADIVAFKNRKQNMWYFYSVQEVMAWLAKQDKLTRANNGCKDAPGWIVKFKWADGMPGYLGSKQGSPQRS